MSTPPPIPPHQMNYATPVGYGVMNSNQLTVDGTLLIGSPVMELPDRCVKCNEIGVKRMKQDYRWHNPALYILILFPGLLIYAIVAMCVQKKGTAYFSLCQTHAKRRGRFILWMWLIALGIIGAAIGGVALCENRVIDDDFAPLFILGGIFGPLICLIAGMVTARVFSPKYIDASTMRLSGGGRAYLQSLQYRPPVAIPVAAPVQ